MAGPSGRQHGRGQKNAHTFGAKMRPRWPKMLRSRFWFQNQDFGASEGAIDLVFGDLSIPTGPGVPKIELFFIPGPELFPYYFPTGPTLANRPVPDRSRKLLILELKSAPQHVWTPWSDLGPRSVSIFSQRPCQRPWPWMRTISFLDVGEPGTCFFGKNDFESWE